MRVGAHPGRGVRDTAVLVAARIVAALLALGWMLGLTAAAGPVTTGQVLTGIALAELVSVLATLNMESGALRTLPQAIGRGAVAEARGFVRFCLAAASLGGMLVAFVFLAVTTAIGDGTPTKLSLTIACAIPAVAQARVLARLGTALGRTPSTGLPRLLLPGASLLGLVVIEGDAIVAWQMLAGFALAYAVATILQWLGLRRAGALPPPGPLALAAWRSWLHAGLSLLPALGLQEYRRSLLVATAATALGAAQIAGFGIALSLTGFVFFALTAVDSVFAAALAKAVQTGSADTRDRLLQRSSAIKLALVLAGLGVLLALFWIGLPALGFPADSATLSVALLLLSVPFLQAVLGPSGPLLVITGRFEALLRAALSGLAATVALTFLGAMTGSGAAAALGAAAGLVLHQTALRRFWLRSGGVDPAPWAVRQRLSGQACRP